jgi:hypothetical protein
MDCAARGVIGEAHDVQGVPEHDGLVVETSPGNLLELDAAIRASTTRPLSVKPYPQTMPALLKVAAERYPEDDWSIKSQFEWMRVRKARLNCFEALAAVRRSKVKGKGKGKDDDHEHASMSIHTDFALVVAAHMETQYDHARVRLACVQ